jgi:hypothetical protein
MTQQGMMAVLVIPLLTPITVLVAAVKRLMKIGVFVNQA